MNNSDKNFLVNYSKKVGLKIDSKLTINDVYNSAYILSAENNKQIKYEKQCNHCKQTKNQMEFDHRFDKKHNINYLNFICKDCRVEYNRNYYNKKKQQKHESKWQKLNT